MQFVKANSVRTSLLLMGHSRAGGNPVKNVFGTIEHQRSVGKLSDWIPACAGMTPRDPLARLQFQA